MFSLIAQKLNSRVPSFDARSIAERVKKFEQRYVEAREVTSHLTRIKAISSQMFDVIAKILPNQVTPIAQVPEQLVVQLRPHLDALQSRGMLSYQYGVMGIGFGTAGGGSFGTLTVTIGPELHAIATSQASQG